MNSQRVASPVYNNVILSNGHFQIWVSLQAQNHWNEEKVGSPVTKTKINTDAYTHRQMQLPSPIKQRSFFCNKQRPSQMSITGNTENSSHLQYNPYTEDSKNTVEEALKDCKSQKTRFSAVRQFLLYMTYTHEILIWLPKTRSAQWQRELICPHGWQKSHKATSLGKELWAINGC